MQSSMIHFQGPSNVGYNGHYIHTHNLNYVYNGTPSPFQFDPPHSYNYSLSNHNNNNYLNTDIVNQVALCYGDKIRLRDGREGFVKFIGTIGFNTVQIWYGIVLKTPTGNCNGVHENRLFFESPPGHGLFVARYDIANILSYSASRHRFSIGQRIKCHKGIGIIKFIGEINQSLLYGIELKKHTSAGNNGIYQNTLYFTSKAFHGIFCNENEMKIYPSDNDSSSSSDNEQDIETALNETNFVHILSKYKESNANDYNVYYHNRHNYPSPYLHQSQSELTDIKDDIKEDIKDAILKEYPDSPFDVKSSMRDFVNVANNIFLSYNNPRGLFRLLYSMSAKLKSSSPKYRILDPSNPAVQKKVFKREDTKNNDDIGPDAVKEWLKLLGFDHLDENGLFICPHDQPPLSVINAAQNVCKIWLNKCNKSRKALLNIRKYSKNVNLLRKEIQKTAIKLKCLNEENDDDTDINDRFILKQLIWSVTHHENTEHANVRDVLLLCHPVFTSSKEIMNLLKIRFLEREMDNSLYEHWEIQYRVTSFIQHWMRMYYYQDFYLNPFLEEMTEELMDAMRTYFEHNNDTQRGLKLPNMISKTMDAQRTKLKQRGIIKENENRKSKLSKVLGIKKEFKKANNKKEFERFYSENNKKIAQQLVLISFKHFKGIQSRECLEQNWKGKEKEKRAPNILKVIHHFNSISNYIQITILNASNASKRGKWITKWLRIAIILFELRDFQTLAAIHGALTSQTVYRQSNAWKKVTAKYRLKFEEFKLIYDSRGGYCNLRKIHSETPPPMVPYAGVLLQILFQIDEGNKNKNKDGSVNFSKLMRLHSAIQRITLLQNTSFDEIIKSDIKLQEFIDHQMTKYSHITSDEMYAKSTQTLNKDDPKRLQNKK